MFIRNQNKYLVLTIIMILALALGTFGCGNGEEEVNGTEENGEVEANGTEENGEVIDNGDEEVPVAVNEWRNPTDKTEVISMFSTLEWTWSRMENEDTTQEQHVKYSHEGTETIDAVETDIILFSVEDEEVLIWVDGDGNSVQGEYEGQLWTGPVLQQALDGLLAAIFTPFQAVEQWGVKEFLEGEYPGIEWTSISEQREQFGDMQANVTVIEMYIEPPMVIEGKERTVTWSVADFDGEFQMVVEWVDDPDTSDIAISYKLTNIAPR